MSKSSVCVVGPSHMFTSGISYYTIRLANAFSEENNVSVVCYRKMLPSFLFPGKERIGKEISDLKYADEIDVLNGMDFASPSSWREARQFVKEKQPDYVIYQWWTSSIAHMLLNLLKGVKRSSSKTVNILEMHEVIDQLEEKNTFLRFYAKRMGKKIRDRIDLFVTHSQSDKDLVAERYGIELDRIHVIPHGLYDHYKETELGEAKRQIGASEEDTTLFYFGLIRPYKGVSYLIDAFPKVVEKHPSARLVLVGEIWEGKEELEAKVEASPVKDRITTRFDYVDDDEVALYFSASDLLVLPYTRASQSGVAHIGMVYGRPIVASSVGGLKESLGIYEGTSFAEPENVDSLTHAILKAIPSTSTRFQPPLEMQWPRIVERFGEIVEQDQSRGID